ncbi:MAG: hypothetical protein A2Y38_13335 [Spirochaetes bacterium GWB1_59_5]|nr:MAG: hypothetical protein A2Y38_13335 [Spirochaetes bacterium GWB1_59_5]
MPATQSVAEVRPKSFDPILEVVRAGRRAAHACDLAAEGSEWSPQILRLAADLLDEGSPRAGCRRRWPHLAGRLRRIAALWIAQRMRVGGAA